MEYSIIIRPLIGALIGYITNYIAVKMMFKPLKPIKFGRFTLPFTPGIIPKNQNRLAESVAETVSHNLITEIDLKNNLLSEDIKQKIKEKTKNYLNEINNDKTTIKDLSNTYISNEKYNEIETKLINYISSNIFETVKKENLGHLIANQIELAAKEKMKSSILGFLGGNSIISTISGDIELNLNEYINNNGQLLIKNMVSKELLKYTESPITTTLSNLSINNENISEIIITMYEKIITDNFSSILEYINISKIVKDKINEMDIKELEEIILKIMKKELNALVNLGAIIGFILGMLNLLI